MAEECPAPAAKKQKVAPAKLPPDVSEKCGFDLPPLVDVSDIEESSDDDLPDLDLLDDDESGDDVERPTKTAKTMKTTTILPLSNVKDNKQDADSQDNDTIIKSEPRTPGAVDALTKALSKASVQATIDEASSSSASRSSNKRPLLGHLR